MKNSLLLLRKAYVNEMTIPFKPIREFKLSENVKGKSVKGKGCLQEFTVLIGCLESHGYNNHSCPKEAEAFNTCFENFSKNKKKLKESKDAIPIYSNTYTQVQIKNYMKKFKQ